MATLPAELDPSPSTRSVAARSEPPLSWESSSDWPERVFVGGVWAVLFAGALYLVAAFASPIPYMDDWAIVWVLSGDEPLTLSWLWSPIQMHRIPVTKFLKWLSWNLGGGSPRAGMLFSVVLLGGLALALIVGARRLRGRASYADAFFPLALLHWGHAIVLLWFWSIATASSTCLVGLILLILLTPDWQRRPGRITALGVCLLLLALHATGIAYVVPVGAAMAYAGLIRWRSAEATGRRDALMILGFAAAAGAIVGLSFLAFQGDSASPPARSPLIQSAITSLEFVTMSLACVGARAWPVSGLLIAAATLANAGVLAAAWLRRPAERVRVVGLFMVLAGVGIFGFGVGRVRPSGLSPQYALHAIPCLIAVYFAWGLYTAPAVGRLVQMGLFTFMCAMSSYHLSLGLELGKDRRNATQSFVEDIRAGLPLSGVAGRQAPYWCWSEAFLRDGLQLLRHRGVGVFKDLAPDPPMEEVPLPIQPAALHGVKWQDGVARCVDADSHLSYSLGQPKFIYAIRLTYSLSNGTGDGMAQPQVYWKGSDQTNPLREQKGIRYPVKLKTGSPIKTQTIWVNDTIDAFRIHPDQEPCEFRLRGITLLVKPPQE